MRENAGMWLGIAGGAVGTIVGVFGGIVGMVNTNRLRRGEPDLRANPQWNVLDWFFVTTMILGLALVSLEVTQDSVWGALFPLTLLAWFGIWWVRLWARRKANR